MDGDEEKREREEKEERRKKRKREKKEEKEEEERRAASSCALTGKRQFANMEIDEAPSHNILQTLWVQDDDARSCKDCKVMRRRLRPAACAR